MPDLNYSIEQHKKKVRFWWKLPEYICERKAFVERNPVCSRCGRPAVTPGHDHEAYIMYESYLNSVKTDSCESLCSACNLMERKNMKPCPQCCKEYHQGKKKKIKYIGQFSEICLDCENGGRDA